MKNSDTPIVKDLVLVGGGHSHVSVLKKFGMKPLPGVRITLVCREPHTPYSGMLPGYVAGHYQYDETHIDLGRLARFANSRFFHSTVTGLDLQNKLVLCDNRPPVSYDVVSLNTGSTPTAPEISNSQNFILPVKPINEFLGRWEALLKRVITNDGLTRIAIVGGGAGGVEITLAMQWRLRKLLSEAGKPIEKLEFHLFSDKPELLTTHNPRVRRAFMRVLEERGVRLHLASAVTEVNTNLIKTNKNEEFKADEILWVTDAGAPDWPRIAGLAVDASGFVKVADTLQSISNPEVYAAGDVAVMVNYPRPKSGVFAVRQGTPLYRNLRKSLLGLKPRPFRPQAKFLSLISTGEKCAIASRGFWTMKGLLLWKWKDWIDRRFMAKYSNLPDMSLDIETNLAPELATKDVVKEISSLAMRCGGCGAKVGASILSRSLNSLTPVQHSDVIIGLHEPDDAAIVEIPPEKVIVHTVDYFRAMVDDPYVFGKIAANHSLGDIFSMGANPQTALAIATVPFGIESKVEDTLTQMMAGAVEILNEAGCALVGGHTSEGPELSLGFSVNGLVEKNTVMRKGGLLPGDKLIITKPIGTGTLFAAEMRCEAKGRWIAGALRYMEMSNQLGAECLLSYGCRGATDITGFGLLGHLVEMLRASEVDIELDLQSIPIMEGALQTIEAGIFSSLQPQNLRLRRAVSNIEEVRNNPMYHLLFDPQTAGGLLAGISADRADTCVSKLKKLGYEASAVIGEVKKVSEQLEPIYIKT